MNRTDKAMLAVLEIPPHAYPKRDRVPVVCVWEDGTLLGGRTAVYRNAAGAKSSLRQILDDVYIANPEPTPSKPWNKRYTRKEIDAFLDRVKVVPLSEWLEQRSKT